MAGRSWARERLRRTAGSLRLTSLVVLWLGWLWLVLVGLLACARLFVGCHSFGLLQAGGKRVSVSRVLKIDVTKAEEDKPQPTEGWKFGRWSILLVAATTHAGLRQGRFVKLRYGGVACCHKRSQAGELGTRPPCPNSFGEAVCGNDANWYRNYRTMEILISLCSGWAMPIRSLELLRLSPPAAHLGLAWYVSRGLSSRRRPRSVETPASCSLAILGYLGTK